MLSDFPISELKSRFTPVFNRLVKAGYEETAYNCMGVSLPGELPTVLLYFSHEEDPWRMFGVKVSFIYPDDLDLSMEPHMTDWAHYEGLSLGPLVDQVCVDVELLCTQAYISGERLGHRTQAALV